MLSTTGIRLAKCPDDFAAQNPPWSFFGPKREDPWRTIFSTLQRGNEIVHGITVLVRTAPNPVGNALSDVCILFRDFASVVTHHRTM